MIDSLLGELVAAGKTEMVITAGEHLAKEIKKSNDIKERWYLTP